MDKSTINITPDKDRRVVTFVAVFYFVFAANDSIQIIVNGSSLSKYISFGILFLSLAIALPDIIIRRAKECIVSESIFAIFFLLSGLMGYAERNVLLKHALWSMCICIPVALAVLSISDKRKLINALYAEGLVSAFMSCVALISMKDTDDYSMSSSYYLLIPVFLMINRFIEKRHIFDLVYPIVCVVISFMFGARGPLLCIAFYILIRIFIAGREKICRLIRFIICYIVCLLLVVGGLLFGIIYSQMKASGSYSRIMRLISEGRIFYSAHRDELFAYYLKQIKDHPLLGMGIGGGGYLWDSDPIIC